MRFVRSLALVLLFGIRFPAALVSQPPDWRRDTSQVNVAALHLTSLDGHPISAKMFERKAVVLNFWAPWCPPCRMEIPWLQKLQEKNASRLVVIGVVADPREYGRAAAFMKARGVTYPITKMSPHLIQSLGEPGGLPETFYISRSGKIVHAVEGVIPEITMSIYAQDATN